MTDWVKDLTRDDFRFERPVDCDAITHSCQRQGLEVVRGLFSTIQLEKIRGEVQQYLTEQIVSAEPGEVYCDQTDSGTPQVRCVFRMQQRSDRFRQLPGEAHRCRFGAVQEPNPVRMTTDLARAGLLMTSRVVKESSCPLIN